MGTVVRSFVNGFVNGLVVSRFWQMGRIDFGNGKRLRYRRWRELLISAYTALNHGDLKGRMERKRCYLRHSQEGDTFRP